METPMKASDYRLMKLKEKQSRTPIINPKYQYLRVKQYAELTGQHISTIYTSLKEGRIEGAVQSGRTWLIPVERPKE